MQRLYAYVDESGQDTGGRYFIVAVIITDQQVINDLEKRLEQIERDTRKGKSKWRPTRFPVRMAYLTRILQLSQLTNSVFYMSFQNTQDYTALTIRTLVYAISARVTGEYRASIIIDGLNVKEQQRVARGLRENKIRRRKLTGGKEQSTALLRLADAMAGFLRDYEESKAYTHEFYRQFTTQRMITRLSQ